MHYALFDGFPLVTLKLKLPQIPPRDTYLAEKKGLLDKGGGDEMGYDFPDKASFHYVVTLLQAALLLLRPVFIDGIIISPFFHGPKPIARAFLQGEGKCECSERKPVQGEAQYVP